MESIAQRSTLQKVFEYAMIWLSVTALFAALYSTSRQTMISEIRNHAMGIAVATAEGIHADEIERLQNPEDRNRPEYEHIQNFLENIWVFNSDVRYIYTMRKSRAPDAAKMDFEFVVDQTERDVNSNGVIDRDEKCEPIGTPYSAAQVPELMNSWDQPGSDMDISSDYPYPDLMSGYAPIKDARDRTVAIVGVDITAVTIREKLMTIKMSIFSVALLVGLLLTLVFQLYSKQRELLRAQNQLIDDLQNALSKVKTLTGLLPICSYCKKVRDDKGYWAQIEDYVITHSKAELSHGICPDCAKRLYPELSGP